MILYVNECDWLEDNHVCFVSSGTLYKNNLLNNTWLKVSLQNKQADESVDNVHDGNSIVSKRFRDHEGGKTDCVLQLVVYENDSIVDLPYENPSSEENKTDIITSRRQSLKVDHIYVSAIALFNICKCNAKLYQSVRHESIPVIATEVKNLSENNRKSYAESVTLSQISCPFVCDLPEDEINRRLHEYFNVPRLLQQNNIFVVKSVSDTVRYNRFHKDLHIRVDGIENSDNFDVTTNSNAVYCYKETTTVFLTGNFNSYVPKCHCLYRKNPAVSFYLNDVNLPQVFCNPISTLDNVMKTFSICSVDLTDTLVLLDSAKGMGKSFMLRHVSLKHCLHYLEVNCFDLIGDSLSASEKRILKMFETCKMVSPCLVHLKNIHVLCRDKEGLNEERRITNFFLTALKDVHPKLPIVIVGSTNQVHQLTQRFHSSFFYHIELAPPGLDERQLFIKCLTQNESDDNFVLKLANKTAGFVFADFLALFRNLKNKYYSSEFDLKHIELTKIESAIDEIRKLKAGKNSDSGKIPNVKWEDVGGLQNVKNDVFDTIDLPLRYPHMFKQDFKRSGLLLYGNPGCGKTLLAKAIATEFSLNFYSVKGPELISMYVGQSEENIRNVFDKARSMAPCVIFFDELDSLAPSRGRSGDSGGVMDRIVSQLLAELDGIHDNTDMFIIGATNRPDLLDTALLRPGRFDKLIYVGLPHGSEERVKILTAVCRKLNLEDNISLYDLEKLCPDYMTGADFSALASDAVMNCYRRLILAHESKGIELDSNNIIISQEDFTNAILSFVPSLSEKELLRYENIKQKMETRLTS